MSVKVGFIGAGGNANWHMDMLKDVPDAEIVGIADFAFEKAKASAEKFGARAYASHKQLLDAEDLDCCYISIAPHHHGVINMAEQGAEADPENTAAPAGVSDIAEQPGEAVRR